LLEIILVLYNLGKIKNVTLITSSKGQLIFFSLFNNKFQGHKSPAVCYSGGSTSKA